MITHVPRELFKITKWINDSILETQSLGVYYVPLDMSREKIREEAMKMGGHFFGSVSTKFSGEYFIRFEEEGFYKAG